MNEQITAVLLDATEQELKDSILEIVENFLYSDIKMSDQEIAKKIADLVRKTYAL